MGVTFVNGFMCTSGCDEAKAKRGVDPHPALNAGKDKADRPGDGKVDGTKPAEEPATVLGGGLAKLTAGGVTPVGAIASAAETQTRLLDILV